MDIEYCAGFRSLFDHSTFELGTISWRLAGWILNTALDFPGPVSSFDHGTFVLGTISCGALIGFGLVFEMQVAKP